MESIQQRLHALGPCVDNAFALMDKLERIVDGGGPDTKKLDFNEFAQSTKMTFPSRHRLALDQLRREWSAILADCTASLEQAKKMVPFRSVSDQLIR